MNTITTNSADWNVELLRFTVFPIPDTQIGEPNWWNDIVGERSETRVIQARKSHFQDKGPYEEGELVLKIEPLRIDWFYRTIQNPEGQDIRNTLGLFQEAIKTFTSLMSKWFALKDFPSPQRIAFGSIIFQPVGSHKAGYEKLAEYLKSVKLDPERSSDFLYQINQPRDSKTDIENLKINRLMKWSVQTIRLIGFVFDEEHRNIYNGQKKFSCRLELDINTVPDPKRHFSAKECQTVFDELVQLAVEISQKGDIK
ncbi:MAG: hypothetical protein KAX28_08350 [Candidatus Marinimicrobia bacterium]|nr:hypothetical protein [Candidatus Neomarinimicrobiota bacterium]